MKRKVKKKIHINIKIAWVGLEPKEVNSKYWLYTIFQTEPTIKINKRAEIKHINSSPWNGVLLTLAVAMPAEMIERAINVNTGALRRGAPIIDF